MTHGIYAGVFDPLTRGHWSVIESGVDLFDEFTIGIGVNPGKNPMFSPEERKSIISDSIAEKMRYYHDSFHGASSLKKVAKLGSIKIEFFDNEFLVKFAEKIGAKFVLRGIRDNEDFRQEQTYNFFNRQIAPDIQTVYVMPDPKYSAVSSSAIKSMIGPNGWHSVIQPYLTEPAYNRIMEKFK